jgi:hypothetical protein
MNGELQALKTDVMVFPQEAEKAEVELSVNVDEVKIELKVTEMQVFDRKPRFARLKKSLLRKRSGSIL